MASLYFRPTDLVDFWLMPWSEPLRNACCWIALFGAPLHGKKPDKDAARWLKPLFMQRWVGQAVADRLAWVKAHPEAAGDRFGDGVGPRLARGWLDAASAAQAAASGRGGGAAAAWPWNWHGWRALPRRRPRW